MFLLSGVHVNFFVTRKQIIHSSPANHSRIDSVVLCKFECKDVPVATTGANLNDKTRPVVIMGANLKVLNPFQIIFATF